MTISLFLLRFSIFATSRSHVVVLAPMKFSRRRRPRFLRLERAKSDASKTSYVSSMGEQAPGAGEATDCGFEAEAQSSAASGTRWYQTACLDRNLGAGWRQYRWTGSRT